jgi:hypothetical protein
VERCKGRGVRDRSLKDIVASRCLVSSRRGAFIPSGRAKLGLSRTLHLLAAALAIGPLGIDTLTGEIRTTGLWWAMKGFGARISAWRHFKGCRADVYRGYHGGLSCRSSLIPRAVITFPLSGIE